MMRKLIAPLGIAAFIVIGSSVGPLLGAARAAGAPQAQASHIPAMQQQNPVTGAGQGYQYTHKVTKPALGAPGARAAAIPHLFVNPAQDGNAFDSRAPEIYTQKYGPVDQNRPLNFADQPAAVPRDYVPGNLYNVQVLKQYNYGQLIGQMAYYTQSMGVQCTYCHNVKNFAYDTPTKRIARTMQIMSDGVTKNWVDPVKRDYPVYRVTGAVGCVTCHRGAPQMAVQWNIIPVQYLDYTNKSTKQAGYVVNSMYSVSRSLGVNCLHCHNSADFLSLQYYPTNQIAHRMWAMVDDINHKYLPPNVEAVTCYTCHQGAKWPSALVKAGLDQQPVQAIAARPEVQENPGAHIGAEVAR